MHVVQVPVGSGNYRSARLLIMPPTAPFIFMTGVLNMMMVIARTTPATGGVHRAVGGRLSFPGSFPGRRGYLERVQARPRGRPDDLMPRE
jgi:hypothetical protein